MSAERIQSVTVNCDCEKVELEILGLNPEYIACHCQLCQLIHAGPGFGAHFNDIKFIRGEGSIKTYFSGKVPMAIWHSCDVCGSRLFFKFLDKYWNSEIDQYVLSVGILNGNANSKEVAKNLKMVREAFCDEKPPYYSFKEDTEKLDSVGAIERYLKLSKAEENEKVLKEWKALAPKELLEKYWS